MNEGDEPKKDNGKKQKKLVTIALTESMNEDVERIRKFCDEEGLYMGRWLVRVAIRAIEEIERDRIEKRLEKYSK